MSRSNNTCGSHTHSPRAMRERLSLPARLVSAPGPRGRTASRVNSLPPCSSITEPSEPTGFAGRRRNAVHDAQQQQSSLKISLEAMQKPAILTHEADVDSESLELIKMMLEEDKRNSDLSSAGAAISDIELSDDELSYEECLEIGEALGDVKKDRWSARAENEINRLDVEVYDPATRSGASQEECTCLVCLSQYECNDVLRVLPCGHAFHICCADQWLLQTNACPCCRKPICQED